MPTSSATRHATRWVGLSAAERQAERRALLLDATFELLGTEGWSGTTVRNVCAAARLNPRYFYESFDDLDSLVVAVYDRVVAELGAHVLSAMAAAGADLAAQVRAALDQIIGFVDEDRRRAKVLYVEALGNEALNRRRIETAHAVVAIVEQHAAQVHGAPPPGEAMPAIAASVLAGGAAELIISWLDGRIAVTREQLVDDATALFLAIGDMAAARAADRSAG